MSKEECHIVEVAPATDKAGPEYRIKIAKDGPPPSPGVATLYEMFQASAARWPDAPCLGRRAPEGGDFTWLTYKEAADAAAAVGSAMAGAAGLGPGGRAGVFSANCPEWMITMQACNRHGVHCVPLYDTLGEGAIEFIIGHAEVTAAFVQADKFATLAAALPKAAAAGGAVKTVVVWGGAPDAAAAGAAKARGVAVYSWDEFVALGAADPRPASPPAPEDLCTIMYTSGTTGDPKGVMITHAAVLATVASMVAFVEGEAGEHFGPDDVYFSFLPLAHIFDRVTEEYMLFQGAAIGYWRGDIRGLVDDIAALRPTLFAGVPRVFERIYDGVEKKVAAGPALKRLLYQWGFARKLHALEAGHAHDAAAPFFDKLVFSKVKQGLGGRVRLIISGGAPLARHVEDFLRVTMCCRVAQGYGLTETCAASFIAVPDVPSMFGTVGPPQPVLSVRLEAVPEMNYDPLASPPRGEVCVRGPSVFAGYYKEPEKTAEVLDADGWFHTGDIGEITPSGALRLVDRKKNIFKLSQGEYVAVEKVENVYKMSPWVEQVWVYGNSYESQLVAVVVPKADALAAWAAGAGASGDAAALCAAPGAAAAAAAALAAVAREAKLKGFEVVKAVHLEPTHFSVENDLLTPTFKLKRPQLQKKYQAQLDAMYAGLKK